MNHQELETQRSPSVSFLQNGGVNVRSLLVYYSLFTSEKDSSDDSISDSKGSSTTKCSLDGLTVFLFGDGEGQPNCSFYTYVFWNCKSLSCISIR